MHDAIDAAGVVAGVLPLLLHVAADAGDGAASGGRAGGVVPN